MIRQTHLSSLAFLLLALNLLTTACLPESQRPVLSIPAGRPNLQEVMVDPAPGGSSRFQKAAQDYRAYLAAHPEDADGHLELGMLLADLELFGEALYHLRLYESATPTPAKQALLDEYLAKCIKEPPTESASEGELVAELTEKNLLVVELKKTIETLQKQTQDLTAENEKLTKRNTELEGRLSIMTSGVDSSPTPARHGSLNLAAPTHTQQTPPVNARNRGTYKVRSGDTLKSIAQAVYGDPARAADIRSANPGKVPPNGTLTVGDVLICP